MIDPHVQSDIGHNSHVVPPTSQEKSLVLHLAMNKKIHVWNVWYFCLYTFSCFYGKCR